MNTTKIQNQINIVQTKLNNAIKNNNHLNAIMAIHQLQRLNHALSYSQTMNIPLGTKKD